MIPDNPKRVIPGKLGLTKTEALPIAWVPD